MSRDRLRGLVTEPCSTHIHNIKGASSQSTTPPRGSTYTHPLRSLRIYCHNVGGLGSGLYEDLVSFLDQSHYDIALIQETKLQNDSEYTTPQWICVGSGTPAQRHAGVLILIRRALTDVAAVRHTAVVPGRLLRERRASFAVVVVLFVSLSAGAMSLGEHGERPGSLIFFASLLKPTQRNRNK